MIVADASVLMEVLLRTAIGAEIERQLFAPGLSGRCLAAANLGFARQLHGLRRGIYCARRGARFAIDDLRSRLRCARSQS
jgi:hypothetical protein